MILFKEAKRVMLTLEFRMLLAELCCSPDSVLARSTPSGCICVRSTEREDLTRPGTRRKVHDLLSIAYRVEMEIHVWASTPCTSGCPWSYVNDSLGFTTGDPELSDSPIKACIPLCRHCHRLGGSFFPGNGPTETGTGSGTTLLTSSPVVVRSLALLPALPWASSSRLAMMGISTCGSAG